MKDGSTEWQVDVDKGEGRQFVAKGTTQAEALKSALTYLGMRILDKADFPPGKIANFSKDANLVRNVAVLRTALNSLYKEVRKFEEKLPKEAHSIQDFNVNEISALLAVKFDWFSVSMLNLMEGVSLLDTLAHNVDYAQLASNLEGMKLIESCAKKYTESIPEAKALRLWRDKVAAHRSGIRPPPPRKASDSLTSKYISLMGTHVMAKNGRYFAPGGIPHGDWQAPVNPELKEWSLTETWESLASKRYRWLNDGNFFDEINSWSVSPGIRLCNMTVQNLTEQEIREIQAGGVPSSLDLKPEQ